MKKYLKFLPLIPITLLLVIATLSYVKSRPSPYPEQKADSSLPEYSEVTLSHTHNYNGDDYLPIVGSAIIDVENDGVPELVIGGGDGQQDIIYKFSNGEFKKHLEIKRELFDSTYAFSIADFDNNGYDDILVARESGGYLYYNNSGVFQSKKIELHLNKKSRVASFSLADINNDGHIDLFVNAYLTRHSMEGQNIFNKEGYGADSLLLLNNGDDTFKDITKDAGMQYTHNTFMGIFIDVDEDLDLDLVVAHDTGVVKTWKNNGDLTFTDTKNPVSELLGYPMGIGVGDYDNNGLPDFFFSNVGPTAPPFLAKGDITDDQTFYPKLMLLKNLGGFQFTDAARNTKSADYEFSWGIAMADLNLDGRQDIIIAENYVDFPLHKLFRLPGRVLLQKNNQTFASVEKQIGTVNREYEITPLLADFNNDGYLDQIRVNIDGKSKAFISKAGENNFLKVKLPSTARALGSKITVLLSDGSKLYDWHITGEGLCSDQEHIAVFGLGKEKRAVSVSVLTPSGKTLSKQVGKVNTTVQFNSSEI